MVPTVASAVDLVVQLSLSADGVPPVDEVVAVPGRVEAGVIESEQVFIRRGGALVRAAGRPPHDERFAQIGVDVADVLAERAG